MLDLHTDAIHAFWDSYDRRTLYRIIVGIENVENWVLDHNPIIDKLMVALGEAIGDNPNVEFDEKVLIRILATTHAGRALRILQAVDMQKPGTASKLLMYAEEVSNPNAEGKVDPYASMFLKRNLVFERLQLLSRVFAPQRLSLLLKALENEAA